MGIIMHTSNFGQLYAHILGGLLKSLWRNKFLECLNDGKGPRFNLRDSSNTSCPHLKIVPGTITSECQWEVLDHSTLGSDHFPVICAVGMKILSTK